MSGSILGVKRDGNFSSLLRVQTGPAVHSASLKRVPQAFLGVKAAERRA